MSFESASFLVKLTAQCTFKVALISLFRMQRPRKRSKQRIFSCREGDNKSKIKNEPLDFKALKISPDLSLLRVVAIDPGLRQIVTAVAQGDSKSHPKVQGYFLTLAQSSLFWYSEIVMPFALTVS